MKGFSLIELIIVLGVTSLLMGTAISNLRTLENPLASASSGALGFMKVTRTKAIGTTQAFRVLAAGPFRMITETAPSCGSATWTPETSHFLDLPGGTQISDTTFSVCFGPRGFTEASENIDLTDGTHVHRLEIFKAGAVRVLK